MKQYIIWFLLILLIVLRYFTTRPVYHSGDMLRVTGRVLSDPIRYSQSQSVKILGLTVYLPAFSEVFYGEKIIVEGIVQDGKIKEGTLVKKEESGNYLFFFRKKTIDFYNKTLPQPHAGLVAGIVLGSKGAVSKDFYDLTKITGVAHVVVASGMNVTFVASFLIAFLTTFLSRKRAIPFVILGILLYLFISGFDAPLVRAAIMGGITFIAQETGRLITAVRALLISAGIMLVVNPNWIIDIGFILSFTATASLMLFEKRIRRYLSFLPEFLKEGFSTSLAAQIGVAPILFVTFGQFNILSPVINALVLWVVPAIMIFGAVGGIVGFMVPVLGKLILYLAYPLTWWFVNIVSIFN